MQKIQSLEQSRAEQSRAEQSRAEQLNCRKIGLLDTKGFEESQRVYDTEYLSPTVKIGGDPIKILEVKKMDKQIVAMRGRGDNNEQQLELNNSCCTNTITSVQKDNLILEKKSIKIREANKKGYAECEIGGVADLNYVSSTTRRGRVQRGGADMSDSLCGEYP